MECTSSPLPQSLSPALINILQPEPAAAAVSEQPAHGYSDEDSWKTDHKPSEESEVPTQPRHNKNDMINRKIAKRLAEQQFELWHNVRFCEELASAHPSSRNEDGPIGAGEEHEHECEQQMMFMVYELMAECLEYLLVKESRLAKGRQKINEALFANAKLVQDILKVLYTREADSGLHKRSAVLGNVHGCLRKISDIFYQEHTHGPYHFMSILRECPGSKLAACLLTKLALVSIEDWVGDCESSYSDQSFNPLTRHRLLTQKAAKKYALGWYLGRDFLREAQSRVMAVQDARSRQILLSSLLGELGQTPRPLAQQTQGTESSQNQNAGNKYMPALTLEATSEKTRQPDAMHGQLASAQTYSARPLPVIVIESE